MINKLSEPECKYININKYKFIIIYIFLSSKTLNHSIKLNHYIWLFNYINYLYLLFILIFNNLEKRIFIVGPPESEVKNLSLSLSNHLNYTCVSVGDLLKKRNK